MSYCYSTDGEDFCGTFERPIDAINAALKATSDGDVFWIGETRDPIPPEDWWCAADWLDHVSVQDDYDLDCASGWDLSSEKQRQELESLIRPILRDWIDRHGLNPTHYCVDDAARYRNFGGGAIRDTPAAELIT